MVAFELPVEVENCIFTQNKAEYEGGALACAGGSLRVTDCLFVGNSAAKGGALAAYDYGSLTLESCTFRENTADEGGAVYHDTILGRLRATSCTFAFNQASTGAGLYLTTSFQDTSAIGNSIFAFGNAGEGIHWDGVGILDLSCCDIFGNEGGDWVGPISGQLGIDGNFAANPGFCGDQNPDAPLTLAEESPCAPENNPGCGLIGAQPVGCTLTGIDEDLPTRSVISLSQNYPNPFNPRTTIRFDLTRPSRVDLRIYDLSSRLVRNLIRGRVLAASPHEVVWNGRNEDGQMVAAGVYFCRIEAGSCGETRRMTLIK